MPQRLTPALSPAFRRTFHLRLEPRPRQPPVPAAPLGTRVLFGGGGRRYPAPAFCRV